MKRAAIAMVLAATAACVGAATRTPAPPVQNTPAADEVVAAPADAGCAFDIATRDPGATEDEPIDVDGDGDLDPVYRGGDDMFGNTPFHFYLRDGACVRYLGTLEAFMTDRPYCDSTPPAGTICTLVAHRRMMHDDYQDEVYQYGPGGFVQIFAGERYHR